MRLPHQRGIKLRGSLREGETLLQKEMEVGGFDARFPGHMYGTRGGVSFGK